LLSGCFLVAFWLLCGSLLFAVAAVLLRMVFVLAYVVEHVAEYFLKYVVGYLATSSLLSGCFLDAFWSLSGCLLLAVAPAPV
jgi:hypothetical protein